MNLALTAFELTCISLGAGAAFLFDSFFFLSAHHHKIKIVELRILKRLSLMSIIGSAGALCFYMTLLALEFESGADIRISVHVSKIIILGFAFLTALALRRIHLTALMRHQSQYSHLSEHMLAHPDPFVGTAAYSTVSWMFIIFITAIEYRDAMSSFNFGFLSILLAYIILGFVAAKVAIFLKKRLN